MLSYKILRILDKFNSRFENPPKAGPTMIIYFRGQILQYLPVVLYKEFTLKFSTLFFLND